MQAQAGTPWSPRQRWWLQALGYTVLRVAGTEEEERLEPVQARVAAPERPAPPVGRDPDRDIAPPPRRRAPAAPEADAAAPAPAAATSMPRPGSMRRPVGLPDRLQLAVLRASGLPPTDPRLQALLADWPSERLRADPAAKRQLWPLLRALRRPA
ncbi:hypothetical protein EIM48_07580 [Pseudoxanthomonas sp. SGNA-20]|uniref:hypothetical protein n=1 Tax=Pseudoxanthomonas sp. SGNA-20 TaxID=2493088 RepID=UPI000F638D86|nr:hypothetical protein [Pseudoxanthomonas sp. SGNA-20]RRN56390.1 hypothetical protein EIM48_07580 [Pseudoxanthomonas sp. SGNA-20]